MGSFFGAIYLRSSEPAEARRLLDAAPKRARFYLAPPKDGWTAIYPSEHGQDERLSRALAKKTAGLVLHTLVHDEDVFCYFLYREGKLLEKFNSCPDYFNEGLPTKRKRSPRKPKHIYDLLAEPEDRPKLEAIFARDPEEGMVMASGTLTQFAAALRLPHACTSYEYLKGGETEEIEDFDAYVHVPDIGIEEAIAAKREAELAAAHTRLRAAGVLLYHDQRKLAKRDDHIDATVNPDGRGGFFVTWNYRGSRCVSELWRLASPWTEPVRLDFAKSDRVGNVAVSPSGRYVAFDQGMSAIIWDCEAHAMLPGFDGATCPHVTAFLSDETGYVSLTRESVTIVDLAKTARRREFLLPGEHGHRMFVHPGGEFLVIERDQQLCVIRLDDGTCVRKLTVSRGPFTQDNIPNDLLICHWALVAQLDRIDWPTVEAQIMEGAYGTARARDWVETVHRYCHHYRTGGWLYEYISKCDPETVYDVKWDESGDQMFCATSRGMRGYDWREMVSAGDNSPTQFLAVDAQPFIDERKLNRSLTIKEGITYTIEFDGANNRLLYGGLRGILFSVDLNTHRPVELLDLPGRPAIRSMALSEEHQAVCMATSLDFPSDRENPQPDVVQIWNVAPRVQ
ncbi:MAG: hypothetical protein WD768_02425 [Phycisphaeraceae bacterium]